jgi:hypothetical protein
VQDAVVLYLITKVSYVTRHCFIKNALPASCARKNYKAIAYIKKRKNFTAMDATEENFHQLDIEEQDAQAG